MSVGRPASASSVESGSSPAPANDGLTTTRWSASSGSYPQWWKVDLGLPTTVYGVQTAWFGTRRTYSYRIETSLDGVTFTTAVDRSRNRTVGATSDAFIASARYVRVQVLGVSPSYAWATANEITVNGEVTSTPAPTPTPTLTPPSPAPPTPTPTVTPTLNADHDADPDCCADRDPDPHRQRPRHRHHRGRRRRPDREAGGAASPSPAASSASGCAPPPTSGTSASWSPPAAPARHSTDLTLDVPAASGYKAIVAWRATAGCGTWSA